MSVFHRVPVMYRPLRAWPGPETPAKERKSKWTFKVTAGATLYELSEELARHKATDAYLEVDVPEHHVRRDGQLHANASPRTPGVILYFNTPKSGPMRFANDAHEVWHHNVRGTLLTIQSLRDVVRWGATRDGQQFTGFKALPGATALTMGTTAALAIIEQHCGYRLDMQDGSQALRNAYIMARSNTHPDRNNGARAAWDQVEAAARVLGVANG